MAELSMSAIPGRNSTMFLIKPFMLFGRPFLCNHLHQFSSQAIVLFCAVLNVTSHLLQIVVHSLQRCECVFHESGWDCHLVRLRQPWSALRLSGTLRYHKRHLRFRVEFGTKCLSHIGRQALEVSSQTNSCPAGLDSSFTGLNYSGIDPNDTTTNRQRTQTKTRTDRQTDRQTRRQGIEPETPLPRPQNLNSVAC